MKISTVVVWLAAVILGFGWASEHRKLHETRDELAQLKATILAEPPETALVSESAPAAKSLAADAREQASPTFKNPMAANPMLRKVEEMMKQPGMKAMMRQQLKSQIDADYAGLYAELKLNDEEKARLKELILDRMMAQQELSMAMMKDGQGGESAEVFKKALSESDGQIGEFLGEHSDMERFRYYERTQPVRMQFRMFGGSQKFQDSGQPLTSEQEEKLIGLMTEVGPQGSSKKAGPEGMLEMLDQQAEQVRLQASGFLSADQLDTLEQWQADRRELTRTSLEMSKAFMPAEAP